MESKEKTEAFDLLEQGVVAALETYSNVHRGSGIKSKITTHLFEQARKIVLEQLGLTNEKYVVVFSTPRLAKLLQKQLPANSYQLVSSADMGLALGVKALAIQKGALPKGTPLQAGGGTTRLVAKKWVDWAMAPDKFEAGTPAIINIIAFARALLLTKRYGNDIFLTSTSQKRTINELLYNDELMLFSGEELLNELRKTTLGGNMKVPTTSGFQPFIYLDNSASTPTFTPIWDTFRKTLQQSAPIQKEIVSEVKTICRDFLGATDDYDTIFTSNTTEAINLVAEHLSQNLEEATEPVIVNTLLEHSSNDLPWRFIPNSSLVRLQINGDGFVDLVQLEATLVAYNILKQHGKKRIQLVSVSGASNVLGVCNNLEAISEIAHKYQAQLMVDAAQLVAHRKINMEASGIDYLAFSAHKIYAPFGCGVLLARKGLLKFTPTEMLEIEASGEENSAGIAALGQAIVLIQRIGMDTIHRHEQTLTARALQRMNQIYGLKVFGIQYARYPAFDCKIGVIAFTMRDGMADVVAQKLSIQDGIGIRYGCHCAHILVKQLLYVGPVLERFQRLMLTLFPKLGLPGVARVSFGIENTEADVDALILALNQISRKSKTSITTVYNANHPLTKSEVQNEMSKMISNTAIKVYS